MDDDAMKENDKTTKNAMEEDDMDDPPGLGELDGRPAPVVETPLDGGSEASSSDAKQRLAVAEARIVAKFKFDVHSNTSRFALRDAARAGCGHVSRPRGPRGQRGR